MSTTDLTHSDAVDRLSRPLLLPDATSFADVFSTSHRWTYGEPHKFPPREIRLSAEYGADRPGGRGNEVGPYCIIKARGARWSMDVVANDRVIAALTDRIVTPDDTLSFEIIEHDVSGYALVICQHSYIIGSHWLAYIDPATIPYRPEVQA